MALEGSLSVFQLPEILQMISLQNKTGILTVQGEHDIIAVSFLHGAVVAADALNQTDEEGLGQILSADRVVRADQFAAVLAEQQSSGGRLADLLLQRGLLTRPQLLKALRSQTYNLLLQTLRWKDGSFKFYGGEEVSFEEGFLPISIEELLIRSLSEIEDPAQLPDPTLVYEAVASDRAVRMMDHTFAGVREGSGVWMKAEEKALLERLDGKRTGEELGRDLGLDEHKLRYALYHCSRRVWRASPKGRLPAARPWLRRRPHPSRRRPRPTRAATAARAAPAPAAPAAPRLRPGRAAECCAPTPTTAPDPDRAASMARSPASRRHGRRHGPRRRGGRHAAARHREVARRSIGRPARRRDGVALRPRVLPLPWQGEERDVFDRTQRTAEFLKIDRAARTHFLVEGRYPDDLSRLVAIGTLDPRDERDAAGRRLAYSTDGVSYTLQPVERGEALAELGSTEGITGDFLLDADFLKIPRGRDEAPLVLID
jgi:hypothetical protein